MQKFMGYTKEQSTPIIELFRHKLIHLQPRPSVLHNNIVVASLYEHHYTQKYLLLENAPKDTNIQIKSGWEVVVD
jgi:hypothetical protein